MNTKFGQHLTEIESFLQRSSKTASDEAQGPSTAPAGEGMPTSEETKDVLPGGVAEGSSEKPEGIHLEDVLAGSGTPTETTQTSTSPAGQGVPTSPETEEILPGGAKNASDEFSILSREILGSISAPKTAGDADPAAEKLAKIQNDLVLGHKLASDIFSEPPQVTAPVFSEIESRARAAIAAGYPADKVHAFVAKLAADEGAAEFEGTTVSEDDAAGEMVIAESLAEMVQDGEISPEEAQALAEQIDAESAGGGEMAGGPEAGGDAEGLVLNFVESLAGLVQAGIVPEEFAVEVGSAMDQILGTGGAPEGDAPEGGAPEGGPAPESAPEQESGESEESGEEEEKEEKKEANDPAADAGAPPPPADPAAAGAGAPGSPVPVDPTGKSNEEIVAELEALIQSGQITEEQAIQFLIDNGLITPEQIQAMQQQAGAGGAPADPAAAGAPPPAAPPAV